MALWFTSPSHPLGACSCAIYTKDAGKRRHLHQRELGHASTLGRLSGGLKFHAFPEKALRPAARRS
jgi:hypothetical protein